MPLRDGFVIKCKKGAPQRWLVLADDGSLSFYTDDSCKKRKGDRIGPRAVRAELGESCAGPGPWSVDVPQANRFRLVNAIRTKIVIYHLEVSSPEDAAAWVEAINGASTAPSTPARPPSAAASRATSQSSLSVTSQPAINTDELNTKAKLALQRLEQLPLEPSTASQAVLAAKDLTTIAVTEVKAVFLDTAKSAAVNLAKTVLGALPFGSVAVEIGSAIFGRVVTMRENKDKAADLGTIAKMIAGRSTVIVAKLHAYDDEEGLKNAEDMLGRTFYAFRLTIEVSAPTGLGGNVLRFLGANSAGEALDKALFELREARNTMAFLLGSIDEKSDVMTVKTSSATPAHLKVLAKLKAGSEAVEFWLDNGFDAEVPMTAFLDLLQATAQASGILPAALTAVSFENIVPIFSILATDCGRETVTPARFALLLGSAPSIADCISLHLKGVKVEPAAATEVQNAKSSNLWIAAKQKAVNPIVDRRRVLDPAEYGEDLTRHRAAYVPGTRQWLIDAVRKWAALPASHANRRVFWLQGSAGLGKSVVAAQLVTRYGGNKASSGVFIAAHIFCKHDDQERSSPHRVLATLAHRLAAQVPAVASVYNALLKDETKRAEVIKHASGREGSEVKEAFEVLLAQPLRQAFKTTKPGAGSDVMVLIDALDELNAGPARTSLLELLGEQLPMLPACVRFIVTSRPEDDIVKKLKGLQPYILEKNDAKQRGDLQIYLQQEAVAKTTLKQLAPAQQAEAVTLLLDAADGVFLAARLAAGALQQRDDNIGGGALTLAVVKEFAAGTAGGDKFIDKMYTAALDRVTARLRTLARGDDAEFEFAELQKMMRHTLSVLVACAAPPRLADLPELCGGAAGSQSQGATRGLLSALSLLFGNSGGEHSSSSEGRVVEPLHKSVYDFLQSAERAGAVYVVDVAAGHATLAGACLRLWRESGWKKSANKGGAHLAYALEHKGKHVAECVMRAYRDKSAVCAAAETSCIAAVENAVGLDNWTKRKFWHEVAGKLSYLGARQPASMFNERALQLETKATPERAETLVNLAWDASSAADFTRAEAALQEALAIYEQAGERSNSLRMARLWSSWAEKCSRQGILADALEYHKKALAIRCVALGENHRETASTYNNMGNAYKEKKDYARALEHYEKALKIRRLVLGEQDAKTAATYNNIATVYKEQKKNNRAINFFKKALEIRLAVLDRHHVSTAATYNSMAMLYKEQSNHTLAFECNESALAIRRVALGEQHLDTAASYWGVSIGVEKVSHDIPRAREFMRKAFEIYLARLGPGNPQTESARKRLAELGA